MEQGGIIDSFKYLASLPDESHWLCPRGDVTTANKADTTSVDRKLNAIVQCLELFTDPEDNSSLERFKLSVSRSFSCQYCVRNWHISKKTIRKKYESDYDPELLQHFIDNIELWDLARLSPVIDEAVRKLRNAAGSNTNLFQLLGGQALVALYDCLFIPNLMDKHYLFGERFREAFLGVQVNNKHMRVADVVPAFTAFLFSDYEELRTWAIKSFDKLPGNKVVTAEDYELWLSSYVEKAVNKAAFTTEEEERVIFWAGCNSLMTSLSKDTMVKYICGSNYDIFRMAVQHLQGNSRHLRLILRLFKTLLDKMVFDFWDAVGSMPAVSLLEIIFNNPLLDKLLLAIPQSATTVDPVLDDLTSWIEPLVRSLKMSTRIPSCASVLFQLLERLQDARFSPKVRQVCRKIGIQVLSLTMEEFSGVNFEKDGKVDVGNRMIVREAIKIAEDRLPMLLSASKAPSLEESALARSILSTVLSTECRMIKNDYLALRKETTETSELPRYSTKVWEKIYDDFPHDDYTYSKCIISSISGLVGLEKFITKPETPARQVKLEFNKILGHIKASIANFFNRISEYDSAVLKQLLSEESCSITLISSLFDAYQENYHGVVDIMKQAFGTLGKIEALRGLLEEYFVSTMKALDISIRQAREMETYASMPRFLTTSDNILEIFCSPQRGLLPLKMIPFDQTNKLLIRQFWKTQWLTVGLIFDRTVRWSQIIDKETMVEFTRDVMEYADKLFSYFTAFEQVFQQSGDLLTIDLTTDDTNKITPQGIELLTDVSTILEKVASWLRLRDEALLSMCQVLACKMLKRFHDSGIKLEESALTLCLNMANGLKKKFITNMTPEQKAELMRAVNLHLGIIDNDLDQDEIAEIAEIDYISANQPVLKKIKTEPVDLNKWLTTSTTTDAKPKIKTEAGQTSEKRFVPLVEAVSRKPPSIASKPVAKKPTSSFGGSALMRDLKAGVKHDIRVRNAMQASVPQKIISTEPKRPSSVTAVTPTTTTKPVVTAAVVDSASEESSSEEEDIGNAIFALTRSIKNDNKTRRTGLIEGPRLFPSHRPYNDSTGRRVATVADVRARLTPDLTSLYRKIMSWTFFHDGPFPPDSQRTDYSLVAQSFSSAEQYAATFEPLLMLECWQQILKAKEESTSLPFDLKVVTRLAVDNFVEIQSNVEGSVMAANTFIVSDVVLLSISKDPLQANPETSCLARVHSLTRKPSHVEISFRCLPGQAFLPSVRPNAVLRGLKILSLTPLEREYGALKGLPYYDLCDQIIKGKPHSLMEIPMSKVHGTMKVYKVNEPQARAIVGAVQNDGFSLIQGPPGTGKTKTVVGIVGALLTDDKGTSISIPGGAKSGPAPVLKKLLVCAPSNAAVDELVVRFKDGIRKTTGVNFVPKIVRLGKSDSINAAVRDVTLEELIDRKMNQVEKEESANKGKTEDSDKLRAEMTDLLKQRDTKRQALDQSRSEQKEPSIILRKEADDLSFKIKNLGRQLDEARDQRTTVNRNKDLKRRQFMQEVLDDSQILCATLSGSGHEMLKNLKIEFETVIIDEAAQSIELSALIPLKYGCKKCILVGDPKQLPPTVLSREASKFAYEQSLFVRMQLNHPQSVYLLSIQYRMHPEISMFPSAMFYDSQLIDGPDMYDLREQVWHNSKIFGPYQFFHVAGQEQTRGHSMRNPKEVNIAMKIYARLVTDFPEVDFDGKIGVITPYKTQLADLRQKFSDKYGPDVLKRIEFNTTDAFQGREREIIIFSCVRASQSGTVGFLSDVRRMNVGLTRAKSSLFVLGNAETLQKNEFWGRLVKDARDRGKFTEKNVDNLLDSSTRLPGKKGQKPPQKMTITPSNIDTDPSAFEKQMKAEFDFEMSPIMKLDDSKLGSKSGHPNAVSTADLRLDKFKIEDIGRSLSPTIKQENEHLKRPIMDEGRMDVDKRIRTNDSNDVSSAKNIPPTLPPKPPLAPPGSRGPAPMKRRKNPEDAMFIRRPKARK